MRWYLTWLNYWLLLQQAGIFGKAASKKNRWFPSDSGCWVHYQSEPIMLLIPVIAGGFPAAYFTQIPHAASALP